MREQLLVTEFDLDMAKKKIEDFQLNDCENDGNIDRDHIAGTGKYFVLFLSMW